MKYLWLILFSFISFSLNCYYFIFIGGLSFYLDTYTEAEKAYKDFARNGGGFWIRFYMNISVFFEILLLPLHIGFGMAIKRGKLKNEYKDFLSFIDKITFKKLFFFLAQF